MEGFLLTLAVLADADYIRLEAFDDQLAINAHPRVKCSRWHVTPKIRVVRFLPNRFCFLFARSEIMRTLRKCSIKKKRKAKREAQA
jgi:hypothetical protein